MLYELGYRTGIALGEEVVSLEFDILTRSLAPETISVDRGGLIVNGTRMGSSTSVRLGDKVEVYANASNAEGLPLYVNLFQDGDLAGTFVIVTVPKSGSVFDSQYLALEPYEVLPDSTWTPAVERSVVVYNQHDFSVAATIALSDSPLQEIPKYRVHIHDYHRDMTYVLNGGDGTFKGIVPTNLLGPVSDTTLFDTSGQRNGMAIAYRKSNKIAVFDSFYTPKLEIDSTDPLKVVSAGNTLYVLEKGATALRKFVFDETLTPTESLVEFGTEIADFVSNGTDIAIGSGKTVIDFDGTEYTLTKNAFKLFYEPTADVILVNHGLERGQTHLKGTTGSRNVNYDSNGILYHTYSTVRQAGTPNVIYAGDVNNKLYQQDVTLHSNGLGEVATLDGPTYGITSLGSLIFAPNLYEDIDVKLVEFDIDADVINFGEKQLGYVGETVDSDPVTITGVNTVTPVYLPTETYQNVVLLVNGVPSGRTANVNLGDTLAIRATTTVESGDVETLQVVVGQTIYPYKLLPNEPFILPRNTIFLPKIVAPNVEVCQVHNPIVGLGIGVTQEVTTTNGLLMLNMDPATKATSVTVEDGDTLSICLEGGANACDQTFANITYADRFTTQYRTIVEDDAETPIIAGLTFGAPDALDIQQVVENVGLGDSITSSEATVVLSDVEAEVDVTISDLHDSFLIVNGTQQPGRTAKVRHGDMLQVGLTATYNYLTDHLVSIMFCNNTYHFIAKTIPDYVPDNFYLGFQDGLHIADRVLSDEITVSGLMSGVAVPLVIPYGTIPIVNGEPYVFPEALLDYRGVLRDNYTSTIKNGDTLQLEGYPRPHYGSLKSLHVTIGYRTGDWELGTFTPDGLNVPQADRRIELDGPDVETSFFREPVLVEPESNNAILTGSTRPVLAPRVEAFIVQQNANVISSKPTSIVNSVSSVYSETPRTSVILGSDSVTVAKPTSMLHSVSSKAVKSETEITAQPDYNSSLEAYGNNSVAISVANEHPELFPSGSWIKFESSAPYATAYERPVVFKVNQVTFTESDVREFSYEVPTPKATVTMDPAPVWVKDEIRAPVKAVNESLKNSIVYPPKEFVLFDGEFFKPDIPNTIKGSRPTEWKLDTSDGRNLITRPDSKVDPRKPVVASGKTYFVPSRHAQVAITGSYVKDQLTTEQVKGAKTFTVVTSPAVKTFAGTFVKSESSSPVLFTKASAILPTQQPTMWASDTVITSQTDHVKFDAPEFAAVAPTVPIYMPAQTDVFYNAFSNSHLAGTFATAEDAEDDAEARGVIPGAYSIVPYEDRFIWIRIMPCENMCHACPPAGYIRGG